MQQVNGTAAPVHGARVAAVVTNGRFSGPAVAWAERHGIRLVDRHCLELWSREGKPLWEALGGIKRPRRLPSRHAPERNTGKSGFLVVPVGISCHVHQREAVQYRRFLNECFDHAALKLVKGELRGFSKSQRHE